MSAGRAPALGLVGLAAVALLAGTWWGFAGRVRAGELQQPQAGPEFPLPMRGALPAESSEGHLFECWLGDEIVLGRSPALGTASLPRFARAPGEPTFADVTLPDGRPARAVAVSYLPPEPPAPDPLWSVLGDDAGAAAGPHAVRPVEVVVAEPSGELDSILGHLRWLLVASWAVTSILSAAGLTWIVNRGIAPLDALGEQIQGKDEGHLDTPFALPGAAEELEPVVDRLNGFMGRVRGAIEREHAFAAHAAHELRTPLSGLRSTLEVSLSRDRDAEEHRESERASLAIAIQLERLVGKLLDLARTADPGAATARERVPLLPLVRECWTPFSDAAAERGVLLEIDVPEGLAVHSDRQLLGRVVQNLLENLGNYADEESVARLAARSTPRGVELVVENRSATVTQEVVARAFESFYRSDAARSGGGRHAGLGLALCRQIVELLGGTIVADGGRGRFRVTVVLPEARLTPAS